MFARLEPNAAAVAEDFVTTLQHWCSVNTRLCRGFYSAYLRSLHAQARPSPQVPALMDYKPSKMRRRVLLCSVQAQLSDMRSYRWKHRPHPPAKCATATRLRNMKFFRSICRHGSSYTVQKHRPSQMMLSSLLSRVSRCPQYQSLRQASRCFASPASKLADQVVDHVMNNCEVGARDTLRTAIHSQGSQ